MKFPVQSRGIARNTSVQEATKSRVFPAQISTLFPPLTGLRFCYCRAGFNDECRLFLGTEQTCANCASCFPSFSFLNR